MKRRIRIFDKSNKIAFGKTVAKGCFKRIIGAINATKRSALSMQFHICLILITVFLSIFSLPKPILFATSAIDPNVDFLIIDYPDAHKTNLYTPVPFTHKKHYVDYEIPCRGCHHAWKLEARENPLKCMQCHKGKTEKGEGAPLLRNAFHRCCMTCHRNLQKQKKPTGPVKCKGCHIVVDTEPRR